MISTCHYESPLGGILLAADEMGLTGLWFDGEKYLADQLPAVHRVQETPVLTAASAGWTYIFPGGQPDFLPPLHPVGSAFQQSVWKRLLQIPYGQTVTYGEIAQQLAKKQGLARMSAPGCGRSRWAQQNLRYHSLPPGGGRKWEPHRICRRNR